MIGGIIVSLTIGIIIGQNINWEPGRAALSGIGIAAASFVGDLSASYVKRLYGVKDFGNILPEHGGILDRFDSFIFAGAFMYLSQNLYMQE